MSPALAAPAPSGAARRLLVTLGTISHGRTVRGTYDEIGPKIGCSGRTVRRRLYELEAAGLVRLRREPYATTFVEVELLQSD